MSKVTNADFFDQPVKDPIEYAKEYRDDLVVSVNKDREALLELLKEPITIEDLYVSQYDEAWDMLRRDLEALCTMDAFYDALLTDL